MFEVVIDVDSFPATWWLSFNPFEKICAVVNLDHFPNVGLKIKHVENHRLNLVFSHFGSDYHSVFTSTINILNYQFTIVDSTKQLIQNHTSEKNLS